MRIKIILLVAGSVILVIALISSVYFYSKYQQARQLIQKSGQSVDTEKENNAILKKVANHTILPTGEQPRFATVTEVENLRNQPFFKNAQNGDKIIIYSGAKKAILYRVAVDKIIEMGPVLEDAAVASQSASQSSRGRTLVPESEEQAEPQPVTIEILNGSLAPGLASNTESKLKAQFKDQITVLKKSNAKNDYEESRIINLKKVDPKIIQSMAETLNASVSATLPAGEDTPASDILIIVAQ